MCGKGKTGSKMTVDNFIVITFPVPLGIFFYDLPLNSSKNAVNASDINSILAPSLGIHSVQ